jgi:hypothetical protein
VHIEQNYGIWAEELQNCVENSHTFLHRKSQTAQIRNGNAAVSG